MSDDANTINLPKQGNLMFTMPGDVEVLRFEPNGDIYVRGTLVENDREVVQGLRDFISSTVRPTATASGSIVSAGLSVGRTYHDDDSGGFQPGQKHYWIDINVGRRDNEGKPLRILLPRSDSERFRVGERVELHLSKRLTNEQSK